MLYTPARASLRGTPHHEVHAEKRSRLLGTGSQSQFLEVLLPKRLLENNGAKWGDAKANESILALKSVYIQRLERLDLTTSASSAHAETLVYSWPGAIGRH